MKKKVTKIEMSSNKNELGTIWIERLIEKLIFKELQLPISQQSLILSKRYIEKKDINL